MTATKLIVITTTILIDSDVGNDNGNNSDREGNRNGDDNGNNVLIAVVVSSNYHINSVKLTTLYELYSSCDSKQSCQYYMWIHYS